MWFNDIDIELRFGDKRMSAAAPTRHGLARERYLTRNRARRLAEHRAGPGTLPKAALARTKRTIRWFFSVMSHGSAWQRVPFR